MRDVAFACEDNVGQEVGDVSLACEDDNRPQGVRDVAHVCEDDNRVPTLANGSLGNDRTGNLLYSILSCITMQYFPDCEVTKAAIAFISDDRGHGWEHIEDFNKRTFEILFEFGL